MIKIIIIINMLLLSLSSCVQDKKSNRKHVTSLKEVVDTIIVKHKYILDKSYEVNFYSKKHSYYWLIQKDTLNFKLTATKHEKDSTVHLYVQHSQPMLFATLLVRIEQCLPLIKDDYDLSKLSSIYIKSPTHYLDLAKELSNEYEQKFGRKVIPYAQLNKFLLSSSLNTLLNSFIKPLDKKVNRYSIEKFHLMDRKYLSSYLHNIDTTYYPAFTIEGMGVYVNLENHSASSLPCSAQPRS